MNRRNAFAQTLRFTLTIMMTTLFLAQAEAARSRGGSSGGSFFNGTVYLNLSISTVGATQDDINSVIKDHNSTVSGGISSSTLGSGLEGNASFIYRYSGTAYALVLRPGYFWAKSHGSGNGQDYNFDITGTTAFLMFRLYPLENDFIKFYMQVGPGWGQTNSDLKLGTTTAQFTGSAFGGSAGLGVDFCFIPGHCMTIEGNVRYLPVERNTGTGGNCTGSTTGFSQCGSSGEIERSSKDFTTSLSGIIGTLGYTMMF